MNVILIVLLIVNAVLTAYTLFIIFVNNEQLNLNIDELDAHILVLNKKVSDLNKEVERLEYAINALGQAVQEKPKAQYNESVDPVYIPPEWKDFLNGKKEG